jgi:hypothetical protein
MECPRCVLACDALACRSNVEVTSERLKGMDMSDVDLDGELFQSFLAISKAFLDFVNTD